MYYIGRDGDTEDVGLATGSDGISWSKNAGNPIFSDPDWGHTASPKVFVRRSRGQNQDYLMIYQGKMPGEKDTALKIASSTNGIDWNIEGAVAVDHDHVYDPGCIWKGRDGKIHAIVNYPKEGKPSAPYGKSGDMWHYYASREDAKNPDEWKKEGPLRLGGELFGPMDRKVEDLYLQPMGEYLVGFANYFHQPLSMATIDMVAGRNWRDVQRLGSAVYSETERFHEPNLAMGPESVGYDWKLYYYGPDGICMAYVMLGEKRSYPLYSTGSLAGGTTSALGDSTEIPLKGVKSFSVTIELTYDSAATADPGTRVHLRASSNEGTDYDTADYTSFDVALDAGATVRKTVNITPDPEILKVLVENLTSYSITDVKVRGTLG